MPIYVSMNDPKQKGGKQLKAKHFLVFPMLLGWILLCVQMTLLTFVGPNAANQPHDIGKVDAYILTLFFMSLLYICASIISEYLIFDRYIDSKIPFGTLGKIFSFLILISILSALLFQTGLQRFFSNWLIFLIPSVGNIKLRNYFSAKDTKEQLEATDIKANGNIKPNFVKYAIYAVALIIVIEFVTPVLYPSMMNFIFTGHFKVN